MEYQHGTVKWFDGMEGKRFGFIVMEDGREIFFHYNGGYYFYVTTLLGRGREIEITRKAEPLPDPKPGDRVVFRIGRGRKGEKAVPWGYESDYQTQLEILNFPMCRIVKHTFNFREGGATGRDRVVFRGYLEELDRWLDAGGEDAAAYRVGNVADRDSGISTTWRFEMWYPKDRLGLEGEWKEAEDSRDLRQELEMILRS